MNDLNKTVTNLKKNGFGAYFTETPEEARELFFGQLWDKENPGTVSYADSITLKKTGILDRLRSLESISFIETFDRGKTWEENIEQRRKALLADLFLTGTNAVTARGELVNLDMIGNRIGAIVFGPKSVVLTVGINKIVEDIESAKERIKKISAPLNAKRHKNFILPCQKTGYCTDCSSRERICNAWSIIEKCYPKGRIKVIIINQDLGL